VVYAGVDYGAILEMAAAEADVIVWDGGNNDFPFFAPDLLIVVVDPLRPGHEVRYHPGETNLRLADAVVVNKVDRASADDVESVLANVHALNPGAVVIRAASPVRLGPGPDLRGRRVLVVEDGPTITHGGMPSGAGAVAALQDHAGVLVDPRPWAVGSIAATFARYPHIGPVLPAMGYTADELDDLERTIRAVECDVVVTGTPIDLGHLIDSGHPVRHATYEIREIGHPDLADLLAPFVTGTAAQ
jgi:predicted GTPase